MRLSLFLLIISFNIFLNVKGQDNINLTQYVTGISVINPAYSGVNGRFSSQFVCHNQWVGIEGAPKTQAIFVNTPITSYKLGLGAILINEKIGPSSSYAFNLNVAYHTKLTDDIKLSYGLKTMLGYHKEDYIGDQVVDQGDPYFQKVRKGSFYLNFGAGVYISGKNFAIAYSAGPLLKNKLKNIDEDIEFYEINNIMNHYLMGTYAFGINEKFILKPSFLIKSNNNLKATADMSLTGIYNQQFWLGLTYRSSKMMSASTQFQIGEKYRIGYAFDFGVSREYSLKSSGSHELILTMDIQLKKKRFITPRYM